MAKRVAPVPKGYRTATPQLVVRGADAALDWYATVLGAKTLSCTRTDDGLAILQAEMQVGNSVIRVMDEIPAFGFFSPIAYGGAPVGLHLYLKNTDEVWERALAAGAGVLFDLSDTSWGERFGKFVDPFGHVWSVAHRIAIPAKPAVAEAEPMVGPAGDDTIFPDASVTAEVVDRSDIPAGFSVHEPRADNADPTPEQAMHISAAVEAA